MQNGHLLNKLIRFPINANGLGMVNLPHTWNATDGQDGGNDYYRGVCYYVKQISKTDLPQTDCYYLEIKGANSSCDVHLNGKHLAHHDGGYSTWRVDITNDFNNENLLVIAVDNSHNEKVYPQVADFTFYGGLYRDVNIVCVSKSHFCLDYMVVLV
jgi:beta-galactosidase